MCRSASSFHLSSRRRAGPKKGGEGDQRGGRGFCICSECVSKAFQLGKETTKGGLGQESMQFWVTGQRGTERN